MLDELHITGGRNDVLIASDGQEYIDFITGFGAVLLGHSNQSILDRVRLQLDKVWLTGKLSVPVIEEAAELVTSGLPQTYRHQQFYSTGNEAVEFAIRLATTATGRQGLVGFNRSMHGKSIASSALCWQNEFVDVRNIHTLPFVDSTAELEILDQLTQKLASRNIAAVFLELIQGTNGAYEASAEFYKAVNDLCRDHGSLCVVDEVLTGFYRSGSLSYSHQLGLKPDILIFGKAMGNGFPVSALVCQSDIEVSDVMLPGSTFSNNPLAAAAVAATLTEMGRLDMPGLLSNIDRRIRSSLAPLEKQGVKLRGRGALWTLELPDARSAMAVQAESLSANLILSASGRYIRLFPPATVASTHLDKALDVVHAACIKL